MRHWPLFLPFLLRLVWANFFPLLQGRVKKMDFNFLIKNIQDKLCAWKGKLLNKVGWLTLARAVLSSNPIYSMSTMWIPKHAYDDIIHVVCSFIWGRNKNKKGINSVNLEIVT